MNRIKATAYLCGLTISALLTGCGGGNSNNATISGTVNGLVSGASLTLQDNGADNITVSANGGFAFPGKVAGSSSYNVTVATQPSGQTCVVSHGTGTVDYAGDGVGNVSIDCTANATIGVSVTGLNIGQSVTFQLILHNDPNNSNNPAPLIVTANNTSASPIIVQFPTTLPIGTLYNVSVAKQPETSGTTTTPSVQTEGCVATGSFSGGVVPPVGSTTLTQQQITVSFSCSPV